MTVKKAIFASLCIGALLGLALVAVQFGLSRHEVQQTLCVHNLKMLGMALHQYAKANEGQYPDTWAQLYPEFLGDDSNYIAEIFRCPKHPYDKESGSRVATSIDHQFFETVSYVLIPGRTASDGKNTVLAYESADNHGGVGRAELYVDGHCGWNPSKNWR